MYGFLYTLKNESIFFLIEIQFQIRKGNNFHYAIFGLIHVLIKLANMKS